MKVLSFRRIRTNDAICILLCATLAFAAGCAGKKADVEIPVRVKVVQLGTDGRAQGLYYSGVVDAEKNISLSFLTPGTVADVPVREGDRVRKGQLLAKLDCESNKNSFRIAQEKARQMEDAFNRFEPMYKNGNLPEIKMVEIRTGKVQAELAERLARKKVEDCSLAAPADGLISARSIEPGDNAAPGMPALKLVSVENVYAVISVPEHEIGGIKKGAPVAVELSGQGNKRLKGQVADVGVSADPLSRTYIVRVSLKNPDSKILPGMLCNVYIGRTAGADAPAAVVIPASAVKMDGDSRQFVFVVDGPSRRVRKTEIVIDGFREGGVLVVSGLSGNEAVVREGVQKLDDGMLVEVAL